MSNIFAHFGTEATTHNHICFRNDWTVLIGAVDYILGIFVKTIVMVIFYVIG